LTVRPNGEIDLPASMSVVRRRHQKSYLRQAFEIVRLVLGPWKLSPWDYYRYRLYDDERYNWAQRHQFIGDNSCGWIRHSVSDASSRDILDDKLNAAGELRRHGLPAPELRAFFHPSRNARGIVTLRSAAELADHLRSRMEYPFFFKPACSLKGRGAGLAVSYDAASDSISMIDGEQVAVAEFARRIEEFCLFEPSRTSFEPRAGYLFQEVVQQHPAIVEICGPAVCSLRIYAGVDDRGASLFEIVWKIAAPGNATDNFGPPGNIVAAIDHDTGEVLRASRGLGTDREELEVNPNTGRRVVGFQLPFFEELRRLVLKGAVLFPKLRFQGWDVAIGPDGPVIIEVNNSSGFRLGQVASGNGLCTPEFTEFLSRAKRLNSARPFRLPIAWKSPYAIWRIYGVWKLLASFFRRPPSSQ